MNQIRLNETLNNITLLYITKPIVYEVGHDCLAVLRVRSTLSAARGCDLPSTFLFTCSFIGSSGVEVQPFHSAKLLKMLHIILVIFNIGLNKLLHFVTVKEATLCKPNSNDCMYHEETALLPSSSSSFPNTVNSSILAIFIDIIIKSMLYHFLLIVRRKDQSEQVKLMVVIILIVLEQLHVFLVEVFYLLSSCFRFPIEALTTIIHALELTQEK